MIGFPHFDGQWQWETYRGFCFVFLHTEHVRSTGTSIPKTFAKLITNTQKRIKMVNAFIRCLCVQYFRHRLHNCSRLDWKKTLLQASTEIVMTITNDTFPRKLSRKPVGRYQSLNIGMEYRIIPILLIVASYSLQLRENSQNDLRSLTNILNIIIVCMYHGKHCRNIIF